LPLPDDGFFSQQLPHPGDKPAHESITEHINFE
jgi:hypothetical protein